MIVMSDSISALAPALAAAQAAMGSAHLDAKNPHFRSTYASLASCLNAAWPALEANGLSLQQHPGFDVETQLVSVTTLILHKSGQYIQSTCHLPLGGKRDGHGLKSATTYLRRTAIVSVLALPEEDDDGNATSAVSVRQSKKAVPKKAAPKKVGEDELSMYREQLKAAGLDHKMVADFMRTHNKPPAKDATGEQLFNRLEWAKRNVATIVQWGKEA